MVFVISDDEIPAHNVISAGQREERIPSHDEGRPICGALIMRVE